MKLRTSIFIIAASTLVPMLIIVGILLALHFRELREAQLQEYVATARALSLAVDRNFETAIAILKPLALSPSLRISDFKEFHREAQRAVTAHQGAEALVLADQEAQQYVNTRVPFGAPLPRGTYGLPGRIIENKSPVVSNLLIGPVAQRPQVVVGTPVLQKGQVKFALMMALTPAFLQKLLEEQNVPNDSVAMIIDANKVIVARSRDVDQYRGKQASPMLAAKSRELPEGWWTGSPSGSEASYSAHARSELSGWTVVMGIPQAKIDGPLWHTGESLAAIIAVFLLAAVGLAVLFGRRVVAAIDSLCDGAEILATGATVRLEPLRIHEFDQLRLAIENAASQRQLILDANKELEAFSYSVSHDLRAPLRAIDGFSRILLGEHAAGLSAEGQRYLSLVRANTQRMGRLIDDLLVFSRMAGQKVNKQCVSPGDFIRQSLTEQQTEQNGRQLEITIGELTSCQADPALLKQVWTNLISNALKFTRARAPARVEIGCLQQNGEVVYFIKDNGVGFDMRYANKLFRVFQRLHRAEEFEGTGVGLAIVQRVVRRHGGRVWAESEVDKGTSVFFTLEGVDSHG